MPRVTRRWHDGFRLLAVLLADGDKRTWPRCCQRLRGSCWQQGGAGSSDQRTRYHREIFWVRRRGGLLRHARVLLCRRSGTLQTSPGTSDDEVIALLDRAQEGFREPAAAATSADPPIRDEEVRVIAGPVLVAGHLTIPEHPVGVVMFAHGSGSRRHSPRNRYVAEVLNGAGLATLLFDLLTLDEERNRSYVFDIELLARRLVDVTGWLAGQPDTAVLPVGYFGASTGAGAARGRGRRPPCEGGGGGVPGRAARSGRCVADQSRRTDTADRGRS